MLIKANRYRYLWFDENNPTPKPIGSFDLFANKNSTDSTMELWSFGIKDENNHRKGYGQRMLAEALAIANGRPVRLYVYKCNEPAIHIYKKAGFRIIGKYMENSALVMQHDGNRSNNSFVDLNHRKDMPVC